MPLKIDDIFPDYFPFSLDDFFHTFEKLKERSEEVIKLNRIEFDDPTFLLYLFKGEFAVIDPNLTKIRFVGSDIAITSVIIILKEILTGIFAIAHISNEFNVEECLAQILVKLITLAQTNRLAMLEPMMEVSIFGGFSCGYETGDRTKADDTEDDTFSYPEENKSENDPLSHKHARRPSAVEVAAKITNECDLLVLRILYSLFTSRVIFDLSVLCSGPLNTETCERRDRERAYGRHRRRLTLTRLVGRLRRFSATGVDQLKRRLSSLSSNALNAPTLAASLAPPPPLDRLHGGASNHGPALSDALSEVRGYVLRSRHLRRYHCPRLTGLAYEVSTASYFPVSRFSPGPDGMLVGPNGAMRFARTCIPMLLPSYCSAASTIDYDDDSINNQGRPDQSSGESQAAGPSDKADNFLTLRVVDIYDTTQDVLVLNFGSIRNLLAQAHGRRVSSGEAMSPPQSLKVPNPPRGPVSKPEKKKLLTTRSYDSLKTSTNIEIEMRGMLRRIKYLLGSNCDNANNAVISDSELIQYYYYPDTSLDETATSHQPIQTVVGSSCALEYLELPGNEALKIELARDIRAALTFLQFDLGVPSREEGTPFHVVHETEAFGDDKPPLRYKLDRVGRWNLCLTTDH